MGVAESLLVAGIVCIVAAVVGGGVKMLGAEMPVLSSFGRQALLFAVGLAFLFASFMVMQPKPTPSPSASSAASQPQPEASPAPAASQAIPAPGASQPSPAVSQPPVAAAPPLPSPAAPGCAGAALDCLPRSSGPVSFRDLAAANGAAARNLRDGLSTTEAENLSAREGASGRAARLCGIVASNDSSPLGKHLAAVRLTTAGSVSGQASAACLDMAQAFL